MLRQTQKWMLLAIGMWAGQAWISSDAQAANRFLAKAKRAYYKLDYARVTPLLEKALQQPSTKEEEKEIYVLLATMHATYNRPKDARDAFVKVLDRDPDFTLPPKSSPKLRKALQAAKRIRQTNADKQPIVPEGSAGTGTMVDYSDSTRAPVTKQHATPTDAALDLGTQEEEKAFYKTWWFWTIVGSVAVLGAGGGYLAWRLNHPDVPAHDYGPFRVE